MSSFSSPAILIRRIDHQDHDLILTFFSHRWGKITVIAKNAKKSVKRFAGVLELFSLINMVCSKGRGNLPILQEAILVDPFANIRTSIKRTAYASYWAEVINFWSEEGKVDTSLYDLCVKLLGQLDSGDISEEILSIVFQMRFFSIVGLSPHLDACYQCKTPVDRMKQDIMVDIQKGGLFCSDCALPLKSRIYLSKGTIKQLQWVNRDEMDKIGRVRFLQAGIKEGLAFLESFMVFHLGREPKSLKFLKQIRNRA